MTSHRQIFRSSTIIGGSSFVNIIIGIIKVKILAVLLGPAGIGLMGLYQNILGLSSSLAGLGMDRSGVRQVASSADDAETLSVVRRALWLGNLLLGLAGMVILWLLREPIAQWVFNDSTQSASVGWLGTGIFLTLVSGSQTALLQGLRRINDLARVNILSALVAAIIGVLAVYFLGTDGVVWFVLTAPGVNFVVANYYAARLPRPQAAFELAAIRQQWWALLEFGLPLMAASLVTLTTQLAMRSIVLREFGLEASGHFQAAWAISMTYIGFVLNAMAMDFYPRLTTVVSEPERARQLVNEQAEMALLLAAPMLMAMISLAPWVINLLYANSFSPAADLLRWQVLGDILRTASWPIAFVFLAAGRGGIYIVIQIFWSAIYLGAPLLGIERFGLIMTGVGFAAAHLSTFALVLLLANRQIEYRPTRRNLSVLALLLLAGGTVIFLVERSVQTATAVGLLVTLLTCIYCLRRLNQLINLADWLRLRVS